MTTEGNTRSAQEGSYHPAQKKSRLFLFLVAVVVVLVIIGIFTMLQHREQYNALGKCNLTEIERIGTSVQSTN